MILVHVHKNHGTITITNNHGNYPSRICRNSDFGIQKLTFSYAANKNSSGLLPKLTAFPRKGIVDGIYGGNFWKKNTIGIFVEMKWGQTSISITG